MAKNHLKRLARIAMIRRQAREDLFQAIKEASKDGISVSDIANVVGMSRQRVYQILEEVSTTNNG